MPSIELTDQVAKDFKRIVDHLIQHEAANAESRIGAILEAIRALESNPRIGQLSSNDLRELVIGRDSRGYLALYRYAADLDIVFVQAIRAQHEAGYFQT